MKDIFQSSYPDLGIEQKFKDGDIIDDAKVNWNVYLITFILNFTII